MWIQAHKKSKDAVGSNLPEDKRRQICNYSQHSPRAAHKHMEASLNMMSAVKKETSANAKIGSIKSREGGWFCSQIMTKYFLQ